jgi:pyruvate,water dikinase
VADVIVPLNLLDPKAPSFTPENCRTLHDIMRLIHEFSYLEMFQISEIVSDSGAGSLKLDAPIPLDLFIIDLGGGLSDISANAKKVKVDKIASLPFKALLKGLLHEKLRFQKPRPVELSGFFSVMREQMLVNPNASERFGDRSYAIIADKYLNFSSRVGYHYSVLDCYCGQTINKNYITFSFKGGAADDVRRNRRARSIAIILMALDFSVNVKGDRVDARFQKYEQPVIEEKLDSLGRLLQFTRQMDMLMRSEATVETVAKNFLDGNYDYRLIGNNVTRPDCMFQRSDGQRTCIGSRTHFHRSHRLSGLGQQRQPHTGLDALPASQTKVDFNSFRGFPDPVHHRLATLCHEFFDAPRKHEDTGKANRSAAGK